MTLRVNGDRKIENLRMYHPEIVDQLRALLATGARATPDPRRPNFYDVYDGRRVFFIHISPVSGTVMLLATWLDDTFLCTRQASVSEVRSQVAVG
jgi:hypothetical protein